MALLPLSLVVLTRLMANHWIGPDLAAHDAAGGARGSWRVTILVGVVGFLVVSALIILSVVVRDIVSPLHIMPT